MSSPNLPAGFFIATINGQRCTAVPRSLTTLAGSDATAAAGQPPTTTIQASTQPPATSTQVITSTTPAAVPVPVPVPAPTTLATSIIQETTADTSPPPSTPAVESVTGTPGSPGASAILPPIVVTPVESAVSSSPTTISAIAASRSVTPTLSPSSPPGVAQSEVYATATPANGEKNGVDSSLPSETTSSLRYLATYSTQPEESTAASDISSEPKLTTGPVIGGVSGSLGLIAIVVLLFWFFRRKRRDRGSLLTPLDTGERSSLYDADSRSVGPSGRGNKWRTEIGYRTDQVRNVGSDIKARIVAVGASLKSQVARDRSDSPSVDLDRGHSQFLDGPIPQHSRSNSALSNPAHVSIKEKATDWWERLREKMPLGWGKNSEAARGMTEKRAMANGSPDPPQRLGMDDRDLQIPAERRRASLAGNTGSLPQLGSPGLNFNTAEDPFADPKKTSNTTPTPGWKPPNANAKSNPFADPTPRSNPFADPVSRPDPTIPKSNTYISDIRRSRGQSIDATPFEPRHPAALAPSRNSHRDTVFPSFSANAGKENERSDDPFDLERPELWIPRDSSLYPNPLKSIKESNLKANSRSAYTQNQRRIISTATYTSRYSRRFSSVVDWGDPGPAIVGPSQNSSLRGNASSNGGSVDWTGGRPQGAGLGGDG